MAQPLYWHSTAYQFPNGDLAGDISFIRRYFRAVPKTFPNQVEAERAISGVRRFITVHIPATVGLEDAWLERWKTQLGQKTAHPRRTLDEVQRVPSGGVAIRWEVENVSEARLMTILKELLPTPPAPPGGPA